MTDRDIVVANDEVVDGTKLAKGEPAGTPAKPGFISVQCRLADALEDDEVRQLLKAGHRLER